MSWLDKLIPFKDAADSLTGTFDTWVAEETIDRDKAIELSTHVKTLQIGLEQSAMDLATKQLDLDAALLQLKEKSYQLELKTKTSPRVDAFHKLARTLLAFFQTSVNALVVLIFAYWGMELSGNVMAVLGIGATGTAIYTYQKGKGAPVK